MESGAFMWIFLGIMIIMMIISMFSQNKRAKERQAQLDAIKSGDKIETIGRIFGEVLEVDGDKLIVNIGVGSTVKISIHKEAVARVIS